jgi:general secretion pathway protein B
MSMILDALRRAEADRQRGAVPGLHAPSPTLAGPAPVGPQRPGAAQALAGAGLSLALLVVAGWWWLGRAAPPAGPGAAVQPPVAAVDTGPVSAPAAAPAVAVAAPTGWPRVVSALPAPPMPAAETGKAAADDWAAEPADGGTTPPPALRPSQSLAGTAASTDPAPASPPTRAVPPTPAPTPAPGAPAALPGVGTGPAPAPTTTAARRLADLPPAERSALPPLVLGGSVWSDNRSSRFVVLDGQVLREGDTIAPGLVLERLAPRAALLRWRGTAIELPL